MTGGPSSRDPSAAGPVGGLRLRRSQRLSKANDFRAILRGKLSKPAGPLVVYARASEAGSHRIGLSVGRRVGNAVVRNRVKRLLREAFRHVQHTMPRTRAGLALDLVIAVRPHAALDRVEYERLLLQAGAKLVSEIDRRVARSEGRDG
ncbi:MAG: ribonuclease P protein component [Phycisphaeraceae bacterium]|nr:MAG: ribonuclease P protein component [Phycisphaeraceae bacterium]